MVIRLTAKLPPPTAFARAVVVANPQITDAIAIVFGHLNVTIARIGKIKDILASKTSVHN
jgi:hypothetical protein